MGEIAGTSLSTSQVPDSPVDMDITNSGQILESTASTLQRASLNKREFRYQRLVIPVNYASVTDINTLSMLIRVSANSLNACYVLLLH